MGARGPGRALERLLGLYFLAHIPLTLLFDLQALLPPGTYPTQLTDLMKWYTETFKDPLMLDPPSWFKSLLWCEVLFQLPLFPIAAYAFFKGSRKWIRIPAIIYSVHLISILIPVCTHILFQNFPKSAHKGPQTLRERLTLLSFYAPYFLIPLTLLVFMLRSPLYKPEEKRKKK
ncbi:sigma intracellular receptor 2 [Ornithorhynchus anatinus]|nr:sigma intracellular receptor 2 [Ornithorhynchus anatinus]